ncbi:uncharacterized protein LOC115560682 [Gadus morhua]|uniref:uncharacterized protein LOC115560682 n=1 Tax=Gadus morhua TaxID=8049 RepID=UPI0011B4608F|nr:uncharacterized protein LOC115560682 [Gadus morhua]
MALNNAIVRNKTIIQEILSADPQFILDKVREKELITGREYTKLNSNKGDAEDLVIKLVDTLINKGRQSEFIGLLQDEKVLETYPKLKDVEWGDSGSTASSSSLSIGHGDNKTVVEQRKKTRGNEGRKRNRSESEEEVTNKKPCTVEGSGSNTETRSAGQALSDKQLMKVAETLGQEWEQAAIHLGLETKDLDTIKAEHRPVVMQKQKMLVLWKRRRPPGEATALDLLEGLEDLEDLPVETRLLLSGHISDKTVVKPKKQIKGHRDEKTLVKPKEPTFLSRDACAEIEDDKDDEEEMYFKSHCEKCKAAQQSPEHEKVTPTKISKWSFQVQLEGEGTYECSATGLVFEVSEQALVRYSVLSWFQFSEFLKDSWRPAGSIYDVRVVNKDPSVLKFIHFPHSLCLTEPGRDLSFNVLHVKDHHPNPESTVGFTASHVKWRVSSLSLLGLILRSIYQWMVKRHAMVLIYKELNKKDFIFHVYLGSNSSSEFKVTKNNGQRLSNRTRVLCVGKPIHG